MTLLVFSSFVWAKETLTYDASGSGAWYPYSIVKDDGTVEGVLPDVVDYVLNAAGLEGQQVNFPAKRTQRIFDSGLIDFDFTSPAWLPADKDTTGFTFSDPIMPIREHIIYLKGTTLPSGILTEQQRNKPNIGVVRGYLFHDEHMFHRVDFRSEKEIVQALLFNRIRWGISGDLTALYWARELGAKLTLGPVHSDAQLHIRIQKDKAYLLPRINDAISMLKQSGRLQQILDRYSTKAVAELAPDTSAKH
ncbi:substrate-binding periplasmic protein [Alteromonas gilva]|uniref:Transporter substrate-binding domain-containing protein n=1 Tax=Alteromonas gilva TaxID=2987522 RepID=A0ABT5L089_9ALTE|nr:transporter substrate-binding domain-containing protein [Alteromonas gilva]MDC8830430.1 transporter substrate-binding domain-containing protein [Alteromonas gilva]